MLSVSDLHDYQIDASKIAFRNKRLGIFIDVGGGKTVIALQIIFRLHQYNPTANILIISPEAVIDSVWMSEPQRWDFTKNLWIKKIKGSNYRNQKFYNQNCHIYTIPDTLLSNWKNLPQKAYHRLLGLNNSRRITPLQISRFEKNQSIKKNEI